MSRDIRTNVDHNDIVHRQLQTLQFSAVVDGNSCHWRQQKLLAIKESPGDQQCRAETVRWIRRCRSPGIHTRVACCRDRSSLPAAQGRSLSHLKHVPSFIVLTLHSAKVIIVLHWIIWSWYSGRWWVGCYILYSEEGTGRSVSEIVQLTTISRRRPLEHNINSVDCTWLRRMSDAFRWWL